MRRGDHATHVMAELIQALESDPHDATDHQEEDATGTHLVEQEIVELDAALSEEPNHEADDTAFTRDISCGLPDRNSKFRGTK